jgi:general secretion pathway protein H
VKNGFTLIELAVVLLILSITAMLVMPRLFPGDDAALKNSARTLASTLRYLQDRAIATRSTYNLKFQFPDGAIAVNTVSDTGEEGAVGDSALRERILAEGVAVEDVVLNTLGRVNDGEVIVRVGMAGLQELLTVHLKSRSGAYTVIAYPVSGKVRIEEGYREATL